MTEFKRAFNDDELEDCHTIYFGVRDELKRAYVHIRNLEQYKKDTKYLLDDAVAKIQQLEALKAKADRMADNPNCNCTHHIDGECRGCKARREYLEAAKELG